MTTEEMCLFSGDSTDFILYNGLIIKRNKLQLKLKRVLDKIQSIEDALSCFDKSDNSDKVSKLNLNWIKYQSKAHKLKIDIFNLNTDIHSHQI